MKVIRGKKNWYSPKSCITNTNTDRNSKISVTAHRSSSHELPESNNQQIQIRKSYGHVPTLNSSAWWGYFMLRVDYWEWLSMWSPYQYLQFLKPETQSWAGWSNTAEPFLCSLLEFQHHQAVFNISHIDKTEKTWKSHPKPGAEKEANSRASYAMLKDKCNHNSKRETTQRFK